MLNLFNLINMSNYNTLITAIQSVIAENGNNEITGSILQQTLVAMINSLGAGFQYIGVADPSTTPGTPDQKVFYLAGPGVYPNFGPATIGDNQIGVFKYSSNWTVELLQFPIADGSVTTPKLADGSVTTPKLADGSITAEKLSSAIYQAIRALTVITANGGDFFIADESGYVIVKFSNGHIKTKNFDSSLIETDVKVDVYNNGDLAISDESGYVILRLKNGNLAVKNFTNAPGADKRFSFLGDSITTYANYPGSNNPYYTGSNAGITNVNMTWWKQICDKQGGQVNRIYANGGMDIVNGLCLHYADLFSNGASGVAPDYVFILGGINDWYHNNTLGTINDAEASNTTFYAAYKYLLKQIKTTYPNATVVCLTILNSMINGTVPPYPNGNGDSIPDFCKAIKDCADYYSVNYIDLNKLVNINGGNYTTLLADNTHPNNIGADKMANAILKNLILL